MPVAPFDVHILALNFARSEPVRAATVDLQEQLEAAGFKVLIDDRDERPGVKFADADLIGIPHRFVIGDRALKEGVIEYKRRRDGHTANVAPADVIALLS